MSKTPVYLITGFLGSGKTTLVKRLLNSYMSGKRIAVVQNEFASESFDGQDVKRSTNREFDLLEINNGSVFCVCLLAGFKESLVRFIEEHNPDLILFETSGLSDPISIGEIMNSTDIQQRAFLAASVCVVDASNFLKLKKLQQRMIHQVQVANQVILNKIDLTENYNSIREEIVKLNPYADIYPTKYCVFDIPDLMTSKHINSEDSTISFTISAEDIGRPDITSVVFKSTKPLQLPHYKKFLRNISASSIRIKGFLFLDNKECLAIQYSGGQLDSGLIDRKEQQTELIAMGYSISIQKVKMLYEKYC